MEALFKQGSFEILTDDVASLKPREMNWLINRCGSVSYQSWKTSKKTTEEFVKMIYDKRHLSVIEHSWFLFFLKAFNDFQKKDIRLNLLDGNHLFCITKRPDGVIVSGNARMFTEAYIRNPTTTTATLLNYLRTQNQILFPIAPREDLVIPMIFQPNPVLKTKKEILTHRAMTVLFDNCSRGLTHEDVRSRNGHNKVVAYTQESTRYVDPTRKGGFKFILPYRNIDLNHKIHLKNDITVSIKEYIEIIEQGYTELIKAGLQPQEARQWLPIGIKSQIVQTFNLSEWLHWLLIRTQKAAHSEIRYVACNLLHEIQQRIPELLEFHFFMDEKGIEYTQFSQISGENLMLI